MKGNLFEVGMPYERKAFNNQVQFVCICKVNKCAFDVGKTGNCMLVCVCVCKFKMFILQNVIMFTQVKRLPLLTYSQRECVSYNFRCSIKTTKADII